MSDPQSALFDAPGAGTPLAPHQTPHQGEMLKLVGMARADAAESDAWKVRFDTAIRTLARRGEPFTAEEACAIAGRPEHPNAVGARMNAAARAGLIRRIGDRQSGRPERHRNRSSVWVGA